MTKTNDELIAAAEKLLEIQQENQGKLHTKIIRDSLKQDVGVKKAQGAFQKLLNRKVLKPADKEDVYVLDEDALEAFIGVLEGAAQSRVKQPEQDNEDN